MKLANESGVQEQFPFLAVNSRSPAARFGLTAARNGMEIGNQDIAVISKRMEYPTWDRLPNQVNSKENQGFRNSTKNKRICARFFVTGCDHHQPPAQL